MQNKKKYKSIVLIRYGSHLYGTNTPQSDLDIKGVYLPSARDILLQRVEPVIVATRSKGLGEKNDSTDTDFELYSPEKFLRSVAKGQSFALEMLFAPESSFLEPPDHLWNEMKKLSMQLLTKQAASFVAYCKQQAYKYGKKGSKLSAARAVLEVLLSAEQTYGTMAPLVKTIDTVMPVVSAHSDLSITSFMQPNGITEKHLQVCGKKIAFHASIKNARQIVQNVIHQYGDRAKQAEQNSGADWKALSHAVRIGHQALEFLTDHRLTFPRPERERLFAIKLGTISYDEVLQEIEQLVGKVEALALKSTLPEASDPHLIDDFIEKTYLQQIQKAELS